MCWMVELVHDVEQAAFADRLIELLDMMDDESGQMTLLYSRANFLNDHVIGKGKDAPSWLKCRPLMLAQWLNSGEEHPGPYATNERMCGWTAGDGSDQ